MIEFISRLRFVRERIKSEDNWAKIMEEKGIISLGFQKGSRLNCINSFVIINRYGQVRCLCKTWRLCDNRKPLCRRARE